MTDIRTSGAAGVLYDTAAPHVARNTGPTNAMRTTRALLYELNAAFERASGDDEATVIILAANGPH